MLLEDRILIQAPPAQIFAFFQHMDRHYVDWHPDHVAFRWVEGRGLAPGVVFYFEEYIAGKLQKKTLRFTRIEPDRYIEFVCWNGTNAPYRAGRMRKKTLCSRRSLFLITFRMRYLMRTLSALLFAATLAGCASGPRVLVEPLTDVEGRAPADTVAVYAAPDEVDRDFEEIALLSVTSGERPLQAGAAQERNLAALVEKAKALGADALIVTDNYDPAQPAEHSDDPRRADRVEQAREQTDRGTVSRAVWTTKATAVVYK